MVRQHASAETVGFQSAVAYKSSVPVEFRARHPLVAFRKFGKGQPVRRHEDRRLLLGDGRYTDDLNLARQAFGVVVRSPHAHARIARIDISEARTAPGVLAILTGADAAADGLTNLPCIAPVSNKDGSPCAMPPRPLLVADRVRYVGDNVAFVLAETHVQAQDAAELVRVDYETLPAVVDTAAALGGPAVWDQVRDNICADYELGDLAATARAFERADHVTELDLINNRVVVASMETRGALGTCDAGEGRLTLYTGSQGVHSVRAVMASLFGLSTNQVRVITNDVGGGFGMKAVPHPEQALVLWAARRIGRPVKWIGGRSDAFVSDTHGRDHVTHAELALDEKGMFLAIRVSTLANMGAYLSAFAPVVPTEPAAAMHAAQYSIPAVYVSVKAVFTNTVPVDAYRGAGRPEAAYVVERLVDAAARELEIDPAELRRRNFVAAGDFPHKTVTGLEYDSGNYEKNMDDAMNLADWTGFEVRRADSRARRKPRGIGMATYIEICGTGTGEMAEIKFDPGGAVTLYVGTQSTGQGHETAFAQLVADRLAMPIENIRVLQGDSDAVSYGGGSGGSRSLQAVGPAIAMATDKIIAKAGRIAAHVLEASEADVTFEDGDFRIAGTDRAVSFQEVVEAAFTPASLAPEEEPGLDEAANYKHEAFTFPNGCHICEVEIDPDTGEVDFVNYVIVDDFGHVLNPLLVAGQVHGGVVQGIGQALTESCVYDPSGQLVTGSFMDYCVPRADDLRSFIFRYNEVASPANPLGVKGCGEAGSVGAPPAVVNAILDALHDHGVRHLDMPVTPERVWQALRVGNRGAAA